MSDTTVLSALSATTAAEAANPAAIFLLIAVSSVCVAVLCYGMGWLFHQIDRKWPAGTPYQREGEQ